MPGYMMHLAEGQMIFNKTNQNSTAFAAFMLGTVLPDATGDKELTHFRPACQKNLITKYPDVKYILSIAHCHSLSPYDLGILAHLHLDAQYVTEFWPKYFTFLDKQQQPTAVKEDICEVYLYKTNLHIPFQDFFSNAYFYGEYDRLNPFIIQRLHPYIPIEVPLTPDDIHILEYTSIDMVRLKKDLKHYTTATNTKTTKTIQIFPEDEVLQFLDNSADTFIQLCKSLNFI